MMMISRTMSNHHNSVSEALNLVRNKIRIAFDALPLEKQKKIPNLVAVSKLKPKEMIIEAYNCGQRCFGENYIQELIQKSKDPEILEKCSGIQWHFIGHLQSNKVSKMPSIPNLSMIETVHSVKLANSLNNAFSKSSESQKLAISIQINTSGEPNKNGIEPSETVPVVSHILENCPQLEFKGLMTIGALGRSIALPADKYNEDFVTLVKCKDAICEELNFDPDNVDLSMGMSSDFEHAIAMGSNSVRIGSTIFGARDKKHEKADSPTNVENKESSTSKKSPDITEAVDNINLSPEDSTYLK